MRFTIVVSDKANPKDQWEERYDEENITTQEEAEEWGRQTIERFNLTLRPYEKPRTFISARIDGESKEHDWEKQNSFTKVDRTGTYDAYMCTKCGATGKRRGLSDTVQRDRKYRAKKYDQCPGKGNDHVI